MNLLLEGLALLEDRCTERSVRLAVMPEGLLLQEGLFTAQALPAAGPLP